MNSFDLKMKMTQNHENFKDEDCLNNDDAQNKTLPHKHKNGHK